MLSRHYFRHRNQYSSPTGNEDPMKKVAAFRICLALLAGSVVFASPSAAQAVADKQSVLSQARQSYYNLRSQGLSSFACSVIPNWGLALWQAVKENPDRANAAIQILNQLHFTVNLGVDNSVKLTHNELTGQSEQTMAGLKQASLGM